ncbi:MFS transporter, partial [Rahnella sp. L72c]
GFLGIGFGMMIPAIQSSASLAVTKDEQGGVSGFLFGASAFGYIIGPVLGTYIYSIDPNMLFLICIMVTFLSIFSTRIVLNKK